MANFQRLGMLATAVLLTGCATKPASGEHVNKVENLSAAQPVVGDECEFEDFKPSRLEPDVPVLAPTEERAGPSETVDSAASRLVPVDSIKLPKGELYCLAPGGAYPSGYVTANCAADSDCPGAASCDGSLCRKSCAADDECKAPSRCGLVGRNLKSCICLRCLEERPGEADETEEETSTEVRGSILPVPTAPPTVPSSPTSTTESSAPK